MERLNQLKGQLQSYQKLQIDFQDQGRIGIIYLFSPKDLNALSSTMRQEIGQVLNIFNRDPLVKVIVFMSKNEKAFCAGADITGFVKESLEKQLIDDPFIDFHTSFMNVTKPIIMAVQGFVLGGGLETTLLGDIIIAREDTKFGLPEVKLGLIPGLGGTQRLTHIIGRARASRFILSGDTFTAKDALQWGLVSEVFPKETFEAEVFKIAHKLSCLASTALISAKKAVKAAEDFGVTTGVGVERALFQPLYNTKGAKEGIDAFLNKRKANFNDL